MYMMYTYQIQDVAEKKTFRLKIDFIYELMYTMVYIYEGLFL